MRALLRTAQDDFALDEAFFLILTQFANALRRDLKAVELSMTTPWSNGPRRKNHRHYP
jgi:hypothetical protein